MAGGGHRFHMRSMTHHIGLITPAKALGSIYGIEIEACNGWIVSHEDFKPHYLNEIRLTEPPSDANAYGNYFHSILRISHT